MAREKVRDFERIHKPHQTTSGHHPYDSSSLSLIPTASVAELPDPDHLKGFPPLYCNTTIRQQPCAFSFCLPVVVVVVLLEAFLGTNSSSWEPIALLVPSNFLLSIRLYYTAAATVQAFQLSNANHLLLYRCLLPITTTTTRRETVMATFPSRSDPCGLMASGKARRHRIAASGMLTMMRSAVTATIVEPLHSTQQQEHQQRQNRQEHSSTSSSLPSSPSSAVLPEPNESDETLPQSASDPYAWAYRRKDLEGLDGASVSSTSSSPPSGDEGVEVSHSSSSSSPELTRQLVSRWVVRGMLLPAAAVSVVLPGGLHWTTAVAAAFLAPVLAIVQGSLGILQFRVRFGRAPVPVTPSHGVVYAEDPPRSAKTGTSRRNRENRRDEAAATVTERDRLLSHRAGTARSAVADASSAKLSSTKSIDDARKLPPVRLLVIGDSLAIGVGQRHSAFPVLPSAIARTLSRKLGRVVYWTCHGAPGASTGWIVRELERGVASSSSPHSHSSALSPATPTATSCSLAPEAVVVDWKKRDPASSPPRNQTASCSAEGLMSRQSSISSEVSDEEISNDDPHEAGPWRDRLAAHRRRFNPDLLGPYDIVIVLTGSNDLKSAFFPFLLTGEDAEFRRQAQMRGGSYSKELTRLVETLYDKMKVQIQHFRESIQTGVDQVRTQVEAATESVRERVEQATESVRERMEETMERIMIPKGKGSKSSLEQLVFPSSSRSGCPRSHKGEEDMSALKSGLDTRNLEASSTTSTDDSAQGGDNSDDEECESLDGSRRENDDGFESGSAGAEHEDCDDDEASVQRGHSRNFPLVVLPGMPSRALPIFGTVPLRWLACPIVDIMDRHKHDLQADLHPGQVLFVPAPGLEDVREYEHRRGRYWEEKSDENLVLNVHDPPRDPVVHSALERSMQDFYGSHRSWTWRPQSGLFAEDQIHPNDRGYDFWGRYIGHAIYRDWQHA